VGLNDFERKDGGSGWKIKVEEKDAVSYKSCSQKDIWVAVSLQRYEAGIVNRVVGSETKSR